MEKDLNYSQYFESSSKIFLFAVKKWKYLAAVFIVSASLAGVFSGPKFIKPEFEAQAVVYPANLGGYSGETRLEQMFQYLQSNELRDSIIHQFGLYEEYNIDSTKATSKHAVIEGYEDHIEFNSTKFESVEMLARSTDPEKAKAILDKIIYLTDEIIRKTERKKYAEVVRINKMLLDISKHQKDSLQEMVIDMSNKYGILDYLVQTEMVTEAYFEFLLKGKKGPEYVEVKELYDNLKKHGRKYHDLNGQLNKINGEYITRLHNYEHALKDLKKSISHTYVLVKPEVPDKKVSPIRWLIVLVASVSATFFTFLLLIVLGSKKDL